MNTTVATPSTTAKPEVKLTKPDFGQGRYSKLMEETFQDSQIIFGLSPAVADILAREIASEFGKLMAGQKVDIKFGKVNKDNKVTISEACKLKGFTLTPQMHTLVALNYAGQAGKNGFSFGKTQWVPIEAISDYFADLEKKVAALKQ